MVPDKKIFEGFSPYMVMVAILATRPGQFEETYIPLSQKGFI